MKGSKILCTGICLLLYPITNHAQSFTSLGLDASGDCACSCMDAMEISYAYNIAQDSAWFIFESYNNFPADYAYHIAIDMDDTTTNGDTWTGASSGPCMGLMDFDMNHDRVITVWSFLEFIEAFDTGGGSIVNYDVNKTVVNTTTMKISTKLSYIDADMDGVIKLIAGVGQDNYRIHDVLPNTGFYTTAISGLVDEENKVDFTIGPNPVDEVMFVKLIDENKVIDQVFIYDISGKMIEYLKVGTHSTMINTESITKGIYFVTVQSGNFWSTKKFIK